MEDMVFNMELMRNTPVGRGRGRGMFISSFHLPVCMHFKSVSSQTFVVLFALLSEAKLHQVNLREIQGSERRRMKPREIGEDAVRSGRVSPKRSCLSIISASGTW